MTIVTLKVAAQLLEYNINKNLPTFLWGPPGIGKSQVVYQVAESLDRNVIDFRASTRDPVDLHGVPVPDMKARETTWLTPDMLPNVKRHGKKGILFLDELNNCNKAMEAALYGLVLERRVGTYELPPGWAIVAAGNRVSDKAAANRMGTAMKNRFAHIEIGPDPEAWLTWAENSNLRIEIRSFLRWCEDRDKSLLHVMPMGDQNAFPTPRTWEKVSELVSAPIALRRLLIEAQVGEAASIECEGFLQVFQKLPSLKDIVAAPAKAKIPDVTEISLMFALSEMLITNADSKNFGHILIYAARLSKEFEVRVAVEAVKRKPALKETTVFVKWGIKNKEVML